MRNACRPKGRFFCLLMVLAAAVWLTAIVQAQSTGPAMTQVTDTVYRADGTVAKGTVLISWPGFTTADGNAVAAGTLSVQLGSGGAFTASLAPCTGAQPAGVYYKVVYQLVGQEPSTEYWVVPATGSTTIGAVRARLQPSTIAVQGLTRDVADSNYVHVNGDQTLNGVVTFARSPKVPTPQTSGDAANKGYVDAVASSGNLASPPAIGSATPNAGSFTTLAAKTINGVIYVDGNINRTIASALAACTGPCVIDSRGHNETLSSTITWPGYPVTLLLGPYTYTGPGSGPMFVINAYAANGSRIIGSGMTSGNQSNQGNGTTLKAANGNTSDLIELLSGTSGVVQGLTISDLTLDGNNSSRNLLDLDAVRQSQFQRLNLQNCTNRMINSYVTSAAADQGTQFNVFDQITGANCPQILYADGNSNGTSDFTQNTLSNWSVQFTSTSLPGMQFHQADGNQGQMIKIFPTGASYAACLQFDTPIAGSVVGGLVNRFFGLHLGCLTAGHTINAQSGTYGNRFYGYDQIEGQAGPFGAGENFWEGTTHTGVNLYGYGSNAKLMWNMDTYLGRCAMNQLSVDTGGACDHGGSLLGYYFKANYFDTPPGASAYAVNGATVIDSSRNATVNNLTVTGTCTGCGIGSNLNLATPPPIGSTTPNAGSFTTLHSTDSAAKSYPFVDVRAFGAVPDGQYATNCSIASGSAVLTCPAGSGTTANPPFAATDVGKTLLVYAAGPAGCGVSGFCPLLTTIVSYQSTTRVTLVSSAANTPTNPYVIWGTDNTAAIQAAIDNAPQPGATEHMVYFPHAYGQGNTGNPSPGRGFYCVTGTIYLPTETLNRAKYVTLKGDGYMASSIFQLNINKSIIDDQGIGYTGTGTIISGLGLQGLGGYADVMGGNVGGAIYAHHYVQLRVTDGSWISAYQFGIYGAGGGLLQVDGGTTIENTRTAIKIVKESGWNGVGIYIGPNIIIDSQYFGAPITAGGAIDINGAEDVVVEGVHFGPAVTGGISVQNATRVTIANNNFGNSTYCLGIACSYLGAQNLYLANNTAVNVHGNHFRSHYSEAVDIAGNNTGLAMSGNTCTTDNALGCYVITGSNNGGSIRGENFLACGGSSCISGSCGGTGGGLIISDNWAASGVTPSAMSGFPCTQSPMPTALNSTDVAANKVEANSVRLWNMTAGQVALNLPTGNAAYNFNYPINAGAAGQILTSQGGGPSAMTWTSPTGNAAKYVTSNGMAGAAGTTVCDDGSGNLTEAGCSGNTAGYQYLVSKYASIQAAIDAAYNNGTVLGQVIDDRTSPYTGPGFIVRDSVTLNLAATTYTISGTVTYNNGVSNVTAGIISMPGSHIVGAGTSANHGTNVNAGAGLNADLIATSTVGTGAGANAQWWHWGSIANFHMDGKKSQQTAGSCINVENMGETAVLRALEVGNCFRDDIRLEGNYATQSEISNITVNSAGQFGVNLDNFQGVGVLRGLSGDSNATSIIRFNGSQSATLTVLGMKSEEEISGHDPLITIDMPTDGSQPALYVLGGYTYARAGVKDVIKVINGKAGAAPFVTVSNFYVDPNFVNAVNDTVNSRTFAAANMNKVPFSYLPTGSYQSGQAFTFAPGTFIQAGSTALTEIFGSNTDGSSMIAAQGNGDGTSYFTGGLKIGIPNRTQYGLPPEMMARMGSRFLGAGQGYDTNTWVFVPIWKSGDTSNRWIGEPNQRWPEVYAADVNATTATVGTLNVTNCVGCGTTQVNADWNASSGPAQVLNKPAIPAAATATPAMNGTGAAGTSTTYARADHVHPGDTSRVATSTTVNGHPLSSNVTVTAADIGLGNVSNVAQLVASALSTDGTLSANSDSSVPSQKATKTYVDAGLGGKAASNASTTVNGQSCALGSTCTVSASLPYTPTTVPVNGGPISTASNVYLTSANSVRGVSFELPLGVTMMEMTTYINAADTTNTYYDLAIMDTNGAIKCHCSGSGLPVGSTGGKTCTIANAGTSTALSSPITLAPGKYYFLLVSPATYTARFSSAGTTSGYVVWTAYSGPFSGCTVAGGLMAGTTCTVPADSPALLGYSSNLGFTLSR